jgi:glutathione S-transferase
MTMKLLYSPASPFVAKVRLAANHLGIELDCVLVDAVAEQDLLTCNNPLGKIPCLLLENGRAVYDSRSIMRALDRLSGGKLFPVEEDALGDVERLEALCDGINDCAVAAQYERRMRPEEKFHQPWFDRQWGKATRGLDFINDNLPSLDSDLYAGHFALAALTGYLDLRYDGKWQKGHEKLLAWQEEFADKMPAYVGLKPAV